MNHGSTATTPVPTVGLGLKARHYDEALASPAAGLWFEVHPENYMVDGGPRLKWLEAIRREKPLSLHGVGLSLAGDEAPDPEHLARLKTLADRFEPFLMSEHLAWSRGGGVYHPDLLPFPRTRQMLKRVSDNVARAQDVLGRRLLIENPSLYLDLKGHEMGEVDFLVELAAATGCGLLLDLNNVHISANNLGADPRDYLAAVPADLIGEIHLAGFAPDPVHAETLLIDTHDAPVSDAVWTLYAEILARIGPRPTLIERDNNIPDFAELIAERDQAVAIMEACHVQCAA
ncbi:MAG: hypothetical protein ACJAVC_000784 [Brevundimonas sp.]|jgi:uncharacterized protein (UPF0276 family)|uniref:MNIO family bufferin maturase n=1 Tax=Brevundimonas sp. GW460-12-10-14-LB2 TaxID=1827469 RepID=UPI0007BCB962|nr:DUF692 domain-containing protein [Brevundimonas sp. GW460-12-10-14-LB2]ANC52393.1 hypothetical protein A4249_01080 [Brevundimonas sp. GW460-12-10-14-LB2]MEA3472634.1 DUF692 domain-containing protein [Pseudomonadota bacterium]